MQFKYQEGLSTAHRMSPIVSLTVVGIETKRNSKSMFTDQTSITEYIEVYRLAFARGVRAPQTPEHDGTDSHMREYVSNTNLLINSLHKHDQGCIQYEKQSCFY